jgi:hypothetical protein
MTQNIQSLSRCYNRVWLYLKPTPLTKFILAYFCDSLKQFYTHEWENTHKLNG